MRPLAIDLFCGLGGWAEGFLAEGYSVVGFDNGHTAPYAAGAKYPGQLVIQDVLTIHGSQFRNATVIVASPPCQNYSYLAMPWSRSPDFVRPDGDGWEVLNSAAAKEMREKWEREGPDNRLFDACFRIQREAIAAKQQHCISCARTDRGDVRGTRARPHCEQCYIPLIVENVRGAIPWVGRSAWNYGSFHLWGDVPALMPKAFRAMKTIGHVNKRNGHSHTRHLTNQSESDAVKIGGDWFRDPACHSRHGSRSNARRMASAQIAKIPLPLAQHIAAAYRPRIEATA